MSDDIFADFQNWGRMLNQIETLRLEGSLDRHQPGLVRVARYPENWQLRHAALRAMAELQKPSDDVVEAALRILLDDRSDLETRILAGGVLCRTLSKQTGDGTEARRAEVIASLEKFLRAPQPPVLHSSARGWLKAIREPGRAAAAY